MTGNFDRSARAFAEYGLRRIVNASGTETPTGGAPVCPEVIEAVADLVGHWVDMLELQSVACATIAAAFETEAGCVAHCTAAGISTAVAACMTGPDLAAVEQLPDTRDLRSEVILQRGHNITYGGKVSQNVALTGAIVVEIGLVTECGTYHLERAINPQTAAALYVVSHHTAPFGLIDLRTFCAVCKKHEIPVIVDAATEPDPRVFLQAGADLVISSMHKSFSGLTGATIAGRLDLVRACIFQEKGIARPMKVGKEGVIAAIAAVNRWTVLDRAAIRGVLDLRLAKARERLALVSGLSVTIEPDATSGAYSRLHVVVDPAQTGITALALAAELAKQEPSIVVRTLFAEHGLLQVDFRFIDDPTAAYIVESFERVLNAVSRPSARNDELCNPAPNSADLAAEALTRFPLRLRSGLSSSKIAREPVAGTNRGTP